MKKIYSTPVIMELTSFSVCDVITASEVVKFSFDYNNAQGNLDDGFGDRASF